MQPPSGARPGHWRLQQRRLCTQRAAHPVPSHKQPAVEHLSAPALERTERIVTEILTLPISAGHTEAEVDEVVAAVRQFFGG